MNIIIKLRNLIRLIKLIKLIDLMMRKTELWEKCMIWWNNLTLFEQRRYCKEYHDHEAMQFLTTPKIADIFSTELADDLQYCTHCMKDGHTLSECIHAPDNVLMSMGCDIN